MYVWCVFGNAEGSDAFDISACDACSDCVRRGSAQGSKENAVGRVRGDWFVVLTVALSFLMWCVATAADSDKVALGRREPGTGNSARLFSATSSASRTSFHPLSRAGSGVMRESGGLSCRLDAAG